MWERPFLQVTAGMGRWSGGLGDRWMISVCVGGALSFWATPHPITTVVPLWIGLSHKKRMLLLWALWIFMSRNVVINNNVKHIPKSASPIQIWAYLPELPLDRSVPCPHPLLALALFPKSQGWLLPHHTCRRESCASEKHRRSFSNAKTRSLASLPWYCPVVWLTTSSPGTQAESFKGGCLRSVSGDASSWTWDL